MGRATAERKPAEIVLLRPEAGIAALQKHIEQLCRQHRIEWRINPERFHSGWSDLTGRWIETGELRDQATYFVALHEIAHIVEQLPAADEHNDGDTILDHEARAWIWALETSREPIGRDAAFEALDGLSSYARKHACAAVPASLRSTVSRLRSAHPQLGPVVVRVWTADGYLQLTLVG